MRLNTLIFTFTTAYIGLMSIAGADTEATDHFFNDLILNDFTEEHYRFLLNTPLPAMTMVPTMTISVSATASMTASPSSSATSSMTASPSASSTPTTSTAATSSTSTMPSQSNSISVSATSTVVVEPSATSDATNAVEPSATSTVVVEPSATSGATNAVEPSATSTVVVEPSATSSASAIIEPTATSTVVVEPSATSGATNAVNPSATSTVVVEPSATSSASATAEQSTAPSSTSMPSLTGTPSTTKTPTGTPTPSATKTPSTTPTPTKTPTPSTTNTATATATSTATSTSSSTATSTASSTTTASATPTSTVTPTSSPTPTSSLSPGASPSNTPTRTPTSTPSSSSTPTQTPTSTVSASSSNIPAPVIDTSNEPKLDRQESSINVFFDVDTNRAELRGRFECSRILVDAQTTLACSWLSAIQLNIELRPEAMIGAGDSLSLRGGLIRRAGGSAAMPETSFQIGAPNPLPQLAFDIDFAQSVPLCADISIDLQYVLGGGRRSGVNITWELIETTSQDTQNVELIQGIVQDASDTNALSLYIPAHLVEGGADYDFDLRVSNEYGAELTYSDTHNSLIKVSIGIGQSLNVQFSQSSPVRLSRAEALSLRPTITLPVCAEGNSLRASAFTYTYSWSNTIAPSSSFGKLDPITPYVTSDSRRLALPRGLLFPSEDSYTFQFFAEGTTQDNTKSINGTKDIEILVESAPLVVQIAGGSRTASSSDDLILDASSSVDPDFLGQSGDIDLPLGWNSSYAYSWSAKVVNHNIEFEIPTPTSSTPTISSSMLSDLQATLNNPSSVTIEFSVSVTSTLYDSSNTLVRTKSADSTVSITLLQGAVPKLRMSDETQLLSAKQVDPSSRISLLAESASSADEMEILWEAVDNAIELSRGLSSDVGANNPDVAASRLDGLRLILQPGALPAGAVISLRVYAWFTNTPSLKASATVTLRVNRPPVGGIVSTSFSGSSIIAMSTEVQITSSGWRDDASDTPFEYATILLPGNGSIISIPSLSSGVLVKEFGAAATIREILPIGKAEYNYEWTIVSLVKDTIGSVNMATTVVAVKPPAPEDVADVIDGAVVQLRDMVATAGFTEALQLINGVGSLLYLNTNQGNSRRLADSSTASDLVDIVANLAANASEFSVLPSALDALSSLTQDASQLTSDDEQKLLSSLSAFLDLSTNSDSLEPSAASKTLSVLMNLLGNQQTGRARSLAAGSDASIDDVLFKIQRLSSAYLLPNEDEVTVGPVDSISTMQNDNCNVPTSLAFILKRLSSGAKVWNVIGNADDGIGVLTSDVIACGTGISTSELQATVPSIELSKDYILKNVTVEDDDVAVFLTEFGSQFKPATLELGSLDGMSQQQIEAIDAQLLGLGFPTESLGTLSQTENSRRTLRTVRNLDVSAKWNADASVTALGTKVTRYSLLEAPFDAVVSDGKGVISLPLLPASSLNTSSLLTLAQLQSDDGADLVNNLAHNITCPSADQYPGAASTVNVDVPCTEYPSGTLTSISFTCPEASAGATFQVYCPFTVAIASPIRLNANTNQWEAFDSNVIGFDSFHVAFEVPSNGYYSAWVTTAQRQPAAKFVTQGTQTPETPAASNSDDNSWVPVLVGSLALVALAAIIAFIVYTINRSRTPRSATNTETVGEVPTSEEESQVVIDMQ